MFSDQGVMIIFFLILVQSVSDLDVMIIFFLIMVQSVSDQDVMITFSQLWSNVFRSRCHDYLFLTFIQSVSDREGQKEES